MPDFATSDDPAVQAQLDRLAALSLPQGRFGLDRIRALLARLGDPQKRIPPAFHVAGTNGKGSTCAFLRAMLEAQGLRVHVATSPHLVRYNERIRLAGKLIEDAHLAALLAEVLDAAEGLAPSFFEVTMAASFLAFAREPADACVIEVGLGGRFDASNVLESPAACGIASLGIDHEAFLLAPEAGTPGEPLARIAFEKAGIARPGVPLVTFDYAEGANEEIERVASRIQAHLYRQHEAWYVTDLGGEILYCDRQGELYLPRAALPGAHQVLNAGLAIAMLRHQNSVVMSERALADGLDLSKWPARLQRLTEGPLTVLAPGTEVWLDGGHNPDAGQAIAAFFEHPVHVVIGMLASKNPHAIIHALGTKVRTLTVVPIAGHGCHRPEAFGPNALAAETVAEALMALPPDDYPVLIAGSLYLAGQVLKANGDLPD